MIEAGKNLLNYLAQQVHIPFSVTGRLEGNRYLKRNFDHRLPLLLQLHRYPGYKHLMGEQWLHWHDYFELVLMVSGSGVYHCGTQKFDFSCGDIIMVDALKLHGIWDVTQQHTALCIFFHRDAVAEANEDINREFLMGFENLSEGFPPRILAHEVPGNLYDGLHKLCKQWFEPSSEERDLSGLKLRLLEVLYELRHAVKLKTNILRGKVHSKELREPRIRAVLDYIARHSSERISQSSVANVAGMSVSRFRSFFHEVTGWKYSEYLQDVRIERAAMLLRDTVNSVAEVAHASGFSDQSHLQRVFKTKHGITPLMYRKSVRLEIG